MIRPQWGQRLVNIQPMKHPNISTQDKTIHKALPAWMERTNGMLQATVAMAKRLVTTRLLIKTILSRWCSILFQFDFFAAVDAVHGALVEHREFNDALAVRAAAEPK